MIAGTVWRAALLVVAIAVIGLQFDRQTRRTPELATSVPEVIRSSAQSRVAAFAVAGSDPEYALAQAELLIRRRPLPAEHLRILAQAQFAVGKLDESALTIQYAAQRGWRDPLAQQAMLQLALNAGDDAEAARRYLALFLRRDTDDALLQELGLQVLGDPSGEGRKAFVRVLSGGVRWQNIFFGRGMRVIPVAAFADILVEAIESGTRFDCVPLRNVSERLIGRDEVDGQKVAEAVRQNC